MGCTQIGDELCVSSKTSVTEVPHIQMILPPCTYKKHTCVPSSDNKDGPSQFSTLLSLNKYWMDPSNCLDHRHIPCDDIGVFGGLL
jgi:hypothetical protein